MNIGGKGTFKCALSAKVIRANPKTDYTLKEKFYAIRNRLLRGDENDYGVISTKQVTTAGVVLIAQTIAGLAANPATWAWGHFWGTGTTAEAASQTALVSAQAATAGTSTHTAATVGANATFTSTCTLTAASSLSITEHGIFIGVAEDPVLLDRSVFTAIPVDSGNSIAFQYVLQLNSGG